MKTYFCIHSLSNHLTPCDTCLTLLETSPCTTYVYDWMEDMRNPYLNLVVGLVVVSYFHCLMNDLLNGRMMQI